MTPPVKGKRRSSEEGDTQDPSVSPKLDGEQSRSQSPVQLEDSPEAGGEREEEQAFLVSLYKFMKERHTPIERVPHLGFKQINLWKIYKAVEKLGAYELVTGRRLWKNVYDELGGSPGSTSAATCTRRHYERYRLVLPYVRHLKGEEDKPLPPSKPKKQYKMTKDLRGDSSTVERLRKAKEEKLGRQVLSEKSKAEATTNPVPLSSLEPTRECMEQSGPSSGLSLPHVSASDCPEAYKRLLSNFYSKGTHGIMSPLAKKKLLAQVSKAGALQCWEESCQHGAEGPPRKLLEPSVIYSPERPPSPGGVAERVGQMLVTQEALQGPGRRPAEEAPVGLGLPSPIFTNRIHTCPTKVLKPVSQRPQDLTHLKDGVLIRPCSKEGPQLVWGGDASRPSAFHRGGSKDSKPKPKACWVSPMAKAPVESPPSLPAFPGSKRHLEEEGVTHGAKKLWAMSPFLKEVDAKECEAKTIRPDLAVSCLLGSALGPALPEAYRGTMLRWPLNFASSLDPLKGQASHPFSPLVIPAFPAQFLANTAPSTMTTGLQHLSPASFDSAFHHRLYPGSPAWHVPPATAYAAPHFFHLNTKL